MGMEFFASKIKGLRESQHMTTRRMAEIIGVTSAAISYYENCKREPTLSVMEAYSKYFNMTLDELVGMNRR
jgi:transcriptional regulator with XRE-family HTH domain